MHILNSDIASVFAQPLSDALSLAVHICSLSRRYGEAVGGAATIPITLKHIRIWPSR